MLKVALTLIRDREGHQQNRKFAANGSTITTTSTRSQHHISLSINRYYHVPLYCHAVTL